MPRITKRGLRQERILLDEISVREKRISELGDGDMMAYIELKSQIGCLSQKLYRVRAVMKLTFRNYG